MIKSLRILFCIDREVGIMHNRLKKSAFTLLTLTIFIFLSAFVMDMTRKGEPIPDLPKGNPDPTLGIVVRSNSTAKDVLSDSSENIRFVAINERDVGYIRYLGTRKDDFSSKSFSFIDEKYGFSAEAVHKVSISFNVYKTDNPIWQLIRFSPFEPSKPKTKEEVLVYLEQWAHIFDEAGWSRNEYTDSPNPRKIRNYVLPTSEDIIKRRLYCSWSTDSHYEAMIWIDVHENDIYNRRKKIKDTDKVDKYSVSISIDNLPQYPNYSNRKGSSK